MVYERNETFFQASNLSQQLRTYCNNFTQSEKAQKIGRIVWINPETGETKQDSGKLKVCKKKSHQFCLSTRIILLKSFQNVSLC